MNTLNRKSFAPATALALGLFSALTMSAAHADVVFDNGAPTTMNGYGIGGSGSNGSTADDFSIAAGATIHSVGFYFQNYNGVSGWDQQVSYNIFSDAGNQPGAMMAGGSAQNVTAVQSAFNWCCGGKAWLVEFDLASDFVADAGTTYWLQLTGAGGPSPWWVSADAGNGVVGSSGSWYSTGLNFAFTLSTPSDGTVPEPTSLLLTGGALAALGWARRKA